MLGPFRLISVGGRFTAKRAEKADGDPGGDNVTIAVSANFDERTRRLLEIIDPNRRPGRDARLRRLSPCKSFPKEQQTSVPAADDKNVVYQTVSLQGIENVQRALLLEGEVIRFVVPAN